MLERLKTEQKRCAQCVHCVAMMAWLDPDAAASVTHDSIHFQASRGAEIFQAGDPSAGIYFLVGGQVILTKTGAEGQAAVIRLVQPGRIFGYRSWVAQQDHSVTAAALVRSKICLVPKALLDELQRAGRLPLDFFARQLAKDMAECAAVSLEQNSLTKRERLCRLIRGFAEEFGVRAADGSVVFSLPVRRVQLAQVLATTPETISRLIREMERDGLAEFHGARVRLPVRAALQGAPALRVA